MSQSDIRLAGAVGFLVAIASVARSDHRLLIRPGESRRHQPSGDYDRGSARRSALAPAVDRDLWWVGAGGGAATVCYWHPGNTPAAATAEIRSMPWRRTIWAWDAM
jgi:hypothetical protein